MTELRSKVSDPINPNLNTSANEGEHLNENANAGFQSPILYQTATTEQNFVSCSSTPVCASPLNL